MKPHDPLGWVVRVYWLYFRLDGKVDIGEFRTASIALAFVFLPIGWLFIHEPALFNPNSQGITDMFTPLGWSLTLPIGMLALWMQFALRVKRGHDLGQRWTWALPLVVRTVLRLKP